MTRRHIHYEAAFEDFLRRRRWPYVAVDEAKRAIFAGAKLKSFDFIVYPRPSTSLLVDIKGKKLTQPGPRGGRTWQNWITRDDLDGLLSWQRVFGPPYQALLVFTYWLTGQQRIEDAPQAHIFRDRAYLFRAIDAHDYYTNLRPRSAKWNTVAIPERRFHQLAVDFTTNWGA